MRNSKNNSIHHTKPRRSISCTSPALGAQVPDYIADLLDDEKSEVVENHLLDCKYCREMYLAIVRLQEAGRRRRLAADRNVQGTVPEAEPRDSIDQEA